MDITYADACHTIGFDRYQPSTPRKGLSDRLESYHPTQQSPLRTLYVPVLLGSDAMPRADVVATGQAQMRKISQAVIYTYQGPVIPIIARQDTKWHTVFRSSHTNNLSNLARSGKAVSERMNYLDEETDLRLEISRTELCAVRVNQRHFVELVLANEHHVVMGGWVEFMSGVNRYHRVATRMETCNTDVKECWER